MSKKLIHRIQNKFKALAHGLWANVIRFFKTVCKPLVDRYKASIALKKQRTYEKRQQEIFSEITKRFDFDAFGKQFSFFRKENPQSAKDAIEYLGEFTVLVAIKQIEEERFTNQVTLQKTVLLEYSMKRLTELVQEYFRTSAVETFNEISNEYGIFTKLGDRMVAVGHQIKAGIVRLFKGQEVSAEDAPKDFLERILERRFTDEKIDALINSSITQLNQELAQNWSNWAANYYSNSRYSPRFSFKNIPWKDTAITVGGTGVLTSAGSTLVLASGWHTLKWATKNFFPMALLASGVFTLLKSIADKTKVIAELQGVALKVANTVQGHVIEILDTKIKPNMAQDLETERTRMIAQKHFELWETNDDLTEKLKTWIQTIESIFRKIGVRYSEAESKFQMESALVKGREFLKSGPLEAAIFYFGQAFDGFTTYCIRKKNIEGDPSKETYVQLIEKMRDKGLSAEFLLTYNRLRRMRNEFIHEYKLLSKNRYEEVQTDLEEAFQKIEELFIQVL